MNLIFTAIQIRIFLYSLAQTKILEFCATQKTNSIKMSPYSFAILCQLYLILILRLSHFRAIYRQMINSIITSKCKIQTIRSNRINH
jgi:hypothetical protein